MRIPSSAKKVLIVSIAVLFGTGVGAMHATSVGSHFEVPEALDEDELSF